MFRRIAVTNRALCAGDFLTQVDRALATGPAALILREKDLSADGYQRLAEQVQPLCARRGVACILHTFAAAAAALPCQGLHLSLPDLRVLRNAPSPPGLPPIGASVHSLEEAQEACALGAAYLTAGHIFDTGCKPGLPGRGARVSRSGLRGCAGPGLRDWRHPPGKSRPNPPHRRRRRLYDELLYDPVRAGDERRGTGVLLLAPKGSKTAGGVPATSRNAPRCACDARGPQ